jgi:3-hydroxyisobutyrate dehydrogenase-like beta-hydroxyacid dehydrogenase
MNENGSKQLPTIGFLGLGNMGSPMCARLLTAGYKVTAFDINPQALDVATKLGATPAQSAQECASNVDVFFTSKNYRLQQVEHEQFASIKKTGKNY